MPGRGPVGVITDNTVFTFEDTNDEMILAGTYLGIEIETVLDQMGWDVARAPILEETALPTPEELHITREELDSHHIYI